MEESFDTGRVRGPYADLGGDAGSGAKTIRSRRHRRRSQDRDHYALQRPGIGLFGGSGLRDRDMELPLLLPGIRLKTSPTDLRPIKQMRLVRFDGARYVLFSDVLASD